MYKPTFTTQIFKVFLHNDINSLLCYPLKCHVVHYREMKPINRLTSQQHQNHRY